MRFEKKIPVNRDEFHLFQLWKARYGRCFEECFPSRLINSIYFDNSSGLSLFDSVEGFSKRKKCRLRWYGKELKAPFYFEVKNRLNSVGTKDIQKVNDFDLSLTRNSVALLYKNLRKALRPDLRFALDQFRWPVSLISYKRKYFSFKNIRLTLDTEIKSTDLRLNTSNSFDTSFLNAFAILEIKYSLEESDNVKNLFKDFPFSIRKNSKFDNAMSFFSV
tara:strand:- start:57 stop:713 length:657 start_codon:yes stop_codon:yes gene_type:complete